MKHKKSVVDGIDVAMVLVAGLAGLIIAFAVVQFSHQNQQPVKQASVKMLVMTKAHGDDSGEMRQANQQFDSSVIATYMALLQDKQMLTEMADESGSLKQSTVNDLAVQNTGQIITVTINDHKNASKQLNAFVDIFKHKAEQLTGRQNVQTLENVQLSKLEASRLDMKKILVGAILGGAFGLVMTLVRAVYVSKNRD
ncbi:hypothetical protein [Weissella confusa]|uniref:hypothetical protein n=1 Tax=Weissella confusa TaxID=1583 RepID=UPI0016810DD3|nr:hypothetical protein [Weissella confusa]MBD1490992.1 hypothetical protein [Weissella confusa]MBJ7662932.1 hypothetical protein [Weissella confusa]MCT0025105.1 hypothetical protein [Weissella confusa]